ncbi:phosphosulfolactate synthase [Natrialbaceae archaeon A-chndr2]
MSSDYDERFGELYNSRSSKPRGKGKTMVIGDGLYNLGGTNYLQDLIDFVGPWVDEYKMQRGSIGLQSPELLQRKLDLFDENNILVFPGGNFLEAAIHRDLVDDYLQTMNDIGVPGIEVSTTSIEMEVDDKVALIEQASEMGFHVHAEIGKKASETGGEKLSVEEVNHEVDASINAGADMVILEMEQLKQMDGDSVDRGSVLESIVNTYGMEKILFELPLSSYYEVMEQSWWFISRFGPNVNLGNVNPQHVMPLEQQRRGLGQFAFSNNFGDD